MSKRKQIDDDFDFTTWVENAPYGQSSRDGLTLRKALYGAKITMPDKDSWIDFYTTDRLTADEMLGEFHDDKHFEEYGGLKRPIVIFGHKTPRDQAFFYKGSKPTTTYTFGKKTYTGKTILPPRLSKFWNDMEESYGDLHFGVMNRYLDNKDSISAHADDEPEIVRGSAIPSLSLGETRTFEIEPNEKWKKRMPVNLPNNGKLKIKLRHGDVIVMGGNFQQVYKHSVPKVTKENDNVRINVTLRKFNDR